MRKLVLSVAAVAFLVVACGSDGGSSAGSAPSSARLSGTVRVLYAGSLVNTMEHGVGPAFTKATGVRFQGTSAGSTQLASQIKGKVTPGDVFISASPDANTPLMGAANGNWECWYATFATAPLVLGYNPKSKFAADLASKPWNEVITEPGFLLGGTDPKLDPKGKLSAQALAAVNVPTSVVSVFPEEQLVGRLQAGQLDAGFFYSSEATELGIPTVPLGDLKLKATYTVTVLNQAANPAAAAAFVKFLLGDAGLALLNAHGLVLVRPITVTGDATAVPASLHGVVGPR